MAIHSSIIAWRIPVDRGTWWATSHSVTKSRDSTEASYRACMHTLSMVAVPFCILTRNVQEFQLLHILSTILH